MPQNVFYNVFHNPSMGALTAVYIFFLGLGSGSMVTAVGLRWFGGRGYEKAEKIASVVAPLAAMAGGLCLFAELGRPMRAWHFLVYFNPSSVASWGVWIVNVFMACSILYAWLLLRGKTASLKRLGIVALIPAIAAGLYSGVVLYQMRAHALWHTALLPVLFLVSAVACGLAATTLLSVLAGLERDKVRSITRVLAYIIGVDLVLLLVEAVALLLGGHGAEVAATILGGWYGLLFVGVYIGLGLVVPLLLLARSNLGRFAAAVASVLILVGTLALRFVIVFGGEAIPKS
ncbi:MAG: dimethyl sulfoxide reductase anchor subunit [Anaerolineaceae bacterium]|nr:dimethyl sulfoxide reductase anchor subunit [Anaerolineaceae bacterium]